MRVALWSWAQALLCVSARWFMRRPPAFLRAAAARQATDLSVAQAVVGQGEDLAGDRDLRDLACAGFRDPRELLAGVRIRW